VEGTHVDQEEHSRRANGEEIRMSARNIFELALVFGGAAVLIWQFFGPDAAENGLFLIAGASGVSVGLMLLYERLVKPRE
jgi:hypothetical protein